MDFWIIFSAIALAGAAGGLLNALLSENNFVLPFTEKIGDSRVFRFGILGNVGISMMAALVSWGLYGSMATYVVIGTTPTANPAPAITLSAIAGAVLVGVAGARWFTNEVDKAVLKTAATKAAASLPDSAKTAAIAGATPIETLRLVQQLKPNTQP
jgi:hypothetical protein